MSMIIGFAGKKFSGKSQSARLMRDHLIAHYHKRTGVFSFGSPLKTMISALLSSFLSLKEIEYFIYNPQGKEEPIPGLGVSYRILAQTLGTQWGREMIDPDLWVNVLKMNTDRIKLQYLLIDDVRFKNEVDFVVNANGIVVHIIDPDLESTDSHASEQFNPEWATVQVINHKTGLNDHYNTLVASLSEYIS